MADGRPDAPPAEFTRRTPEGESAGPGAPETVEPTLGRPGAGGHGSTAGPGGPAMAGMGAEEGEDGRSATADARLGPREALGLALWTTVGAVSAVVLRARRLVRGPAR